MATVVRLVGPIVAAIERMAAEPESAMMRVGQGGFSGEGETAYRSAHRMEIRILEIALRTVVGEREVVPAGKEVGVVNSR